MGCVHALWGRWRMCEWAVGGARASRAKVVGKRRAQAPCKLIDWLLHACPPVLSHCVRLCSAAPTPGRLSARQTLRHLPVPRPYLPPATPAVMVYSTVTWSEQRLGEGRDGGRLLPPGPVPRSKAASPPHPPLVAPTLSCPAVFVAGIIAAIAVGFGLGANVSGGRRRACGDGGAGGGGSWRVPRLRTRSVLPSPRCLPQRRRRYPDGLPGGLQRLGLPHCAHVCRPPACMPRALPPAPPCRTAPTALAPAWVPRR